MGERSRGKDCPFSHLQSAIEQLKKRKIKKQKILEKTKKQKKKRTCETGGLTALLFVEERTLPIFSAWEVQVWFTGQVAT